MLSKMIVGSRSLSRLRTVMLVGSVLIGAFSLQARGVTYTEQGDAGQLPATAQVVGGAANTALTAIVGTLTINTTTQLSEADLYQISISTPATFSATTTNFAPGTNNFDSQLFLFSLSGVGIVANDDDPNTGEQQSTLPAGNSHITSLAAGSYLLLITGSGQYPATSGGTAIFSNFTDGTTDATGVYGPNTTSPLAGYTGNSNEGGKYSIALTGAQFVVTPEPGGIAAGIFCILLLGLSRSGRRSKRWEARDDLLRLLKSA